MVRNAIASTLALLLAAIAGCRHRADRTLLVAAAASLQTPLGTIARDFEARHPGWHVELDLGGSGALLQSIQAGAPVDVFVSASPSEIAELERDGKVLPALVAPIAHNRIALVTLATDQAVHGWADLAQVERLAIGNPDTVPAGRYARQVLEARRLWDALAPRLVLAENVRQVVEYVATGAVSAGLVYVSDAHDDPRLSIRAIAKESGDPLATYPAAPLRTSRYPTEASDLSHFLESPDATAALRAAGFLP